MTSTDLEVDYLIIGAGATGMAFADSLISETDATLAIVDKHDRPGGHWNDAYSFVRLQQPSLFYGAGSHRLGTGSIDRAGLNKGMFQLASGSEVLYHYDTVLNETFLPTGRVTFFPMSVATQDGTVTSLVTGEERVIKARKVVDATYYEARVPSVVKPNFRVSPEARFVAPNDLPSLTEPVSSFVVIGGGKTGIDTCIWLLQHGIEPDSIAWIIPRDFWIQDRINFQPGAEHLLRFVSSAANQLAATVDAASLDDLFKNLEQVGELRRVDPAIEPTAYHCSVISDGEFEQLSKIRNIIRMGYVQEIQPGKVRLDHGAYESDLSTVYVNCTAQGIYRRAATKVFDGDRIVLQWLRTCQPSFSAALIGFIEATIDDEDTKNYLAQPNIVPDVPSDWLRMLRTNIINHRRWKKVPAIDAWMSTERNRFFADDPRSYGDSRPDVVEQLLRAQSLEDGALAAIDRLLGDGAVADEDDAAALAPVR